MTQTHAASIIASQLVPLTDERLVLPNTTIAEIIDFSQADIQASSVEDAPDWLLGMVAWRGLSVPVVAFERMAGGKYEASASRARLAVLNVAKGAPGVPFIAIPTQTIPQLMQIDETTISVVEDSGEASPVVACHVMVAGSAAIIPALEEVERLVAAVFAGEPEKNKTKNKKK
ncbi:chemotaxis protein CheW [Sulfuriflexus mobilis]|uniref:chemotaxis protein CheW n=1 Tax=Sulfuriflexus mobilis TaxID=1811807 RepID=UPI000F823CF6|nr:chemotaxis protein CheW [Sulfuriflexus mobilis]